VDDVLKKEFGRSLSDENIHILDPFTGTGTFITRLLQSGLIKEEDMERKYRYELHANEIVLLAYYIATVNIENAFHDIFQGTGNGEKGTGISELGMGIVGNKEDYKNSNFNKSGNDNGHESRGNEDLFIQRPDSLAGSYELGGDDLSDNETFSKSGNVWTDKPDEESGSFDPSEHSGGKREEIEKGLSELPEHSPRLSDRVGNSNTYSYESTISNEGNHSTNIRENSNSREIIERSQKIPEPQSLIPSSHYIPFEGICLTDTFQLGESDDADRIFSEMFSKNSERVTKQMKAPLKVIIGNPPYSVGQKSANDNAQNQSYEKLDKRISDTYAALTDATNKNSLYDSYIKAFRWSTDRLGKDGGIICFVSNGAWLDGNSTDGFRKTIEKEFSSIYVFNLRGNQRTSGELSRKEGGKIFGSGSRTPIAITLLVKKGKENG